MYYNRNLITAEQHPASINDASGVFDLQTQAFYRAQNNWPFGDNITGAILVFKNTASSDVQLRRQGTVSCNFTVDWGDGSSLETSTANLLEHTYATGGVYTIKVSVNSGTWIPRANASPLANQIIKYAILNQASGGSSAFRPYQGMQNLKDVTFPPAFYTGITNAQLFFGNCHSLRTALFFDASSATTFNQVFDKCYALESIPLYDTSSSTNFSYCFRSCISLKEIPLLDTSSGTNFVNMCYGCARLNSFPAIDCSSGTNFGYAWFECSNLAHFPANMFDSTGALSTNAFSNAFKGCKLTAQSIENILTSLDTNGATGIQLHVGGGSNASYSTWSQAAKDALTSLQGKSWSVTYNS